MPCATCCRKLLSKHSTYCFRTPGQNGGIIAAELSPKIFLILFNVRWTPTAFFTSRQINAIISIKLVALPNTIPDSVRWILKMSIFQ
jgi:hypothetical protein